MQVEYSLTYSLEYQMLKYLLKIFSLWGIYNLPKLPPLCNFISKIFLVASKSFISKTQLILHIVEETHVLGGNQYICRTKKKIRRAASVDDFSRCCICFELVRWSRHLVIHWGLLGNLMYWSCQRLAGKGLVVVREGISTPNTPYLR